jgi:hypothetical protein
MPLIIDISTARQYVKLDFTNSESSLAFMNNADDRFLVPVLGQELYDLVVSESNVTDSAYATLIELCRKAVAPLAYWLELPNIQVRITDKGIGTTASQNMESAHRWEFESLRDQLADKGCWAMEQLLQHLYDNATTYNWTSPDEYKLIFLTGKEFYKYYPVFQPNRTFEALRPLVRQVEDNCIRNLIGDDFFEELRDKAAPTDEEKKAIAYIKKSVANFTIKSAIETLPVKLSVYGFTVVLSSNSDMPNQGDQHAPSDQLSLLYKSVDRDGGMYLLGLKNYLDNNASESVFATYFAGDYYEAPASRDTTDRNAARVGIVGL